MRCEACKFWEHDNPHYFDSQVAVCTRLSNLQDQVYGADGDNPVLYTRSGFGCVKYIPRENPPSAIEVWRLLKADGAKTVGQVAVLLRADINGTRKMLNTMRDLGIVKRNHSGTFYVSPEAM